MNEIIIILCLNLCIDQHQHCFLELTPSASVAHQIYDVESTFYLIVTIEVDILPPELINLVLRKKFVRNLCPSQDRTRRGRQKEKSFLNFVATKYLKNGVIIISSIQRYKCLFWKRGVYISENNENSRVKWSFCRCNRLFSKTGSNTLYWVLQIVLKIRKKFLSSGATIFRIYYFVYFELRSLTLPSSVIFQHIDLYGPCINKIICHY